MSSVLRSLAAFSFLSTLIALAAPGCSQQGEGERCDKNKNGDLDCDSGLVCVKKNELIDNVTDRCCPAVEGSESDKRCTRGTATSVGGSSSGTPAATAGSSSSAGNDGSGATAGADDSGGSSQGGAG
jgi:hypothetical protein